MLDYAYIEQIAREAGVTAAQAERTAALFDEGATIPFVARYRKDVTGNLDEVKLEAIAQGLESAREFADRKAFILETVEKQGQLSDALRAQIVACMDRAVLEDLYLPFKKAKKTKAAVARDKGLLPLAELLWEQILGKETLAEVAASFVNAEKQVATAEEALEGACHICAERVSLVVDVRSHLRDEMLTKGRIVASPAKNADNQRTKYEAYYKFSEAVASIPSHRFLAIHRGAKEGVLRVAFELDDAAIVEGLVSRFLKEAGSVFAPYVRTFVEDAYARLLRPSIENEVERLVQRRADEEAVRVFRENAQNLLLAPPAGPLVVLGLDPGIRTGCKVAVVTATGDYVESAVIHPNAPQNDVAGAEKTLADLIERHGVQAIAIGNGTGSREASMFVRNFLAKIGRSDIFSVMVSEAGASIYSASPVAREEYPDLDVTIRGAISIAHRLQDPLAELVKLEPKHVGVGQYQHDINQKLLQDGLQRTVVSCVNQVGVDVNTASAALLRYVSGMRSRTARNVVAHRTEHGAFASREQLLDVEGIGPKVFEQCAGFLRVHNGAEPLDATGIHPEAYGIVRKLAETAGKDYPALIGDARALESVDLTAFAEGAIGTHTLDDIKRELARPARDPRKEFRVPQFLPDVTSVDKLEEGMDMEGVVTNVTDFGAFVDVGVHQDGLVHLSELSQRFVKDPHTVVRVGDIVRVRVIAVDKAQPRISLSMKALQPAAAPRQPRPAKDQAAVDGAKSDRPRREGGDRNRDRGKKAGGDRDARPRGPRKPKRDDRKPERKEKEQPKAAPINTLLADQLSALKDRFGS